MRFDIGPAAREHTTGGLLSPRPLLQLPAEDILPRLQRFGSPDPHPTSDAYNK